MINFGSATRANNELQQNLSTVIEDYIISLIKNFYRMNSIKTLTDNALNECILFYASLDLKNHARKHQLSEIPKIYI